MSFRHALLAGAAFFAITTAASAQNAVSTTQIGGSNYSSTYQAGYGNNVALLSQFGVGSNSASAIQLSARGSNLNGMDQVSAFGSNTAVVGQATGNPRGVNYSDVSQIRLFPTHHRAE